MSEAETPKRRRRLSITRKWFQAGETCLEMVDRDTGERAVSRRSASRHDHARLTWDALAAFPREAT